LLLAISVALASILAVVAGIFKLAFRPEFAAAAASWRLPLSNLRWLTVGLPVAESGVGGLTIALLAVGYPRLAAGLIAVLYFGLAGGQLLVLRVAERPSCGCFGRTSGPIGTRTIVRAAVLALLPVAAIIVS
jgi:hypothetical protein